MIRCAALALALIATPALAQPIACQPPADVAPAPAAVPDGPSRSLPITHYTLALIWAPEFCASHPGDDLECRGKVARFGFVLHGLWPDSDNGSWPQWCPATPPATTQVPAFVVRHMLCTTPSVSLIAHEWAKHGTCMAASPQGYFAQSSQMFGSLRFPDMATLARHPALTAGAFRAAFAAANPRYPRAAIDLLLGRGSALQEVHLCHDRKYRPAACPTRGVADDATIRITPP
jgi:ribonuclease T2